MARIFSRNLFSNLTTSAPTNETVTSPCSYFCDPSCDNFEDCYAFPDSIHPLPPPLPPVSIIVSPDTITTQGVHISPLVIIIVIVLASIFLIISYYTIVVKYCTCWNRTSIGHDDQRDLPRPNSDQGDVHALIHENADHDPGIDHPIWLISTVGLHQSVINAITTLRYKKEGGLFDGTDCSVCLSEFQEDETLRLLPKCKHAFHIECIDTWLRSHINCPLCRAGIMANSSRLSLASNDPSFGHSRRVELTPMVDSDSSDVELGNISGVVENNNADHSNSQNKDEVDFNSIIRRSFSMDCFRGPNFRNVGIVNLDTHDSSSSSTRGIDDSSSSSRPNPQGPPPIKRSYSWSERVFWSSRSQIHSNRDVSP